MNELLEILEELHPGVDFEHEEHLFEKGIIDSIDIVSLITEIRSSFDVVITAKDITPENFASASALFALIACLLDEK